MAATRHSRRPDAEAPAIADIIAPDHPRPHATRFRPVFSDMHIIEAEFEDITSKVPQEDESVPVTAGRRGNDGHKLLAWLSRLAAGRPGKPSHLFVASLAGLCALSFWSFGGHAVYAGLAGRTTGKGAPLVISGVSTRLGTIDGMRVAIIDGSVTNRTAARRTIPPIGIRTAAGESPVAIRTADPVLAAGASTGFRARLPIGAGQAPAVDVTFIDNSAQAGRFGEIGR